MTISDPRLHKDAMRAAIEELVFQLGYDTDDLHFKRTPERTFSWLEDFRRNADESKVKELLGVVFPEEVPSELVIVGPTAYRSMCAHHMLPVFGQAWVGYIPEKALCGLSKLSRLVDFYAHQLTVQERVTAQIADALERELNPKGAMVVVRATHFCMSFRGIRDVDATTVTSAVRGLHKESTAARNEFTSLMSGYR